MQWKKRQVRVSANRTQEKGYDWKGSFPDLEIADAERTFKYAKKP